MSLSFALTNTLMGHKVYAMLRPFREQATPSPSSLPTTPNPPQRLWFGNVPRSICPAHSCNTFLPTKPRPTPSAPRMKLDLPTDNWPFFYMDYKMYPASYVCLWSLS